MVFLSAGLVRLTLLLHSSSSQTSKMPSTEMTASNPMRDLAKARDAYNNDDIEASKVAHASKVHNEEHSKVGGFIKSIVFGGLDGIITTFAVVAGGLGGKLSVDTILILGFSSVVADAISMGVGDALSTKSENEYILAEKKREQWEFENNPEGEIEEMIELYVGKGCEPEDAKIIVEKMAKYKDFFINVMMSEELELQVPDPDENPWIDGGVTFLSFVFFGTIPLLAFAVFYNLNLSINTQFIISCCLTACALFSLGVVKSRFTKQAWYSAGMEVFLLGGAVACFAYFAGWFIEQIVLGGSIVEASCGGNVTHV